MIRVKGKYLASQQGFSFIELLVVVVLMGIIGIIMSQIFILNIRSQSKSEVLKEVKQSGDYALSVMESMIRNATDIPDIYCNTNSQSVTIVNKDGFSTTFDCSDAQIASISADAIPPEPNVSLPLTSNKVNVSSCTIRVVCPNPPLSPKYVFIDFSLTQANITTSVENQAQEEFQTTVSLRNYQ